VAYETLAGRRLGPALRARQRGEALSVTFEAALPAAGPFVFAVNHYKAGLTVGSIAAVFMAAAAARPDVLEDGLLIVGQRVRPLPPGTLPSRKLRALRWAAGWFLGRWSRHVLRIPLGEALGLGSLRDFRKRAAVQPILVFPEGRAAVEFKETRPGAGRWLSALPVPTVPVAVWRCERGWHVCFGKPLRWSDRHDLHDLQLGLAIAAHLPPALAPTWQPLLARWRDAHGDAEGES
jgi:hypothetical protein